MNLDGDIDMMLADFGEPVVFGGFTGKGLLDSIDEAVLARGGQHQIGRMKTLTVRTSAFPGIAVGSIITISGATCKVRDRMAEGDGRITRLAVSLEDPSGWGKNWGSDWGGTV